MASCEYCSTTILFGGKRDGEKRFCGSKCQQNALLLARVESLPSALVWQQVSEIHRGNCPRCHGPGPVDVHVSYRVWSALVLTRWTARPLLACQTCGSRRRLGDLTFSAALGWWGFPWGLLVTPVQIGRNLRGLARRQVMEQPSPALEKMVRLRMAQQDS